MAYAYKPLQLADGALTTTLTTTLFTGTAATETLVTCITLCNTHASITRKVTVDVSTRKILDAVAIPPKTTLVWRAPISLPATEGIRGGQDVGTDVDFVITGVERTTA